MGYNRKFLREYIGNGDLINKEKVEHKFIVLILLVITIALYELIYAFTGELMIGYLGIFAVIVGITTFTAGARMGMVCTAISIIYFMTSFVSNVILVLFNGLLLLATVGIVEVIRQKIKVTIRKFGEKQEAIIKDEEKILRDSLQFKEITENMFDIICRTDGQGKLIYVSPSAKSILGYRMDKLNDYDIFFGIHPDEVHSMKKVFGELVNNGGTFSTEFRYKTAEGMYKWMEAVGKCMLDSEGNISGTIISARDITKRKQAIIALKQSEAKFREIFHNTNDAILLHKFLENGLPGRFIEANSKAIEMIGYSKEELMNMTSLDITADDEVDQLHLRILDFMIEDGITYESKLISKENIIIPVEISGHLFILDGETVLISIIRNTTERNQAKETLRLSEEKYRSLVEELPDAVYVHKAGQMNYVNKAAVKLFGMERAEDILGRSMIEFVTVSKEFEEVNSYRREQRENGAVELPLWSYKLDRYDGEIIDVEGISMPILIDGKPGVQFVVRDISERKKIEAIQKKAEQEMELYKEIIEYDRIKTEFFANMSHEIRTPLNLILSALQLMSINIHGKRVIEDAQKLTRYTDIMKQNCYRLLRLVNNLIEITKLDSGYIEPNFKNQNIVCLVEDIVLSVVDYVEDKSLHLSFDTNEEEMITACDADMLERIILNLLSNAIKYTKPGDHIDVRMDVQNDKVKICVKDSGIGIPEDKQKIVFERFRQVDKLFTRTTEGSGIGLSLVKGLVEVQGGTIYLNSRYGEGSEFIVELPVRKLGQGEDLFEEVAVSQLRERVERINIEFSDIYD